jgi:Tol biopolymer transport system component
MNPRALTLALVACGCGRLGFDELGPGPGATHEPAGIPERIPTLEAPSATEAHPSASADLRELYFGSDRDGGQGGFDIWRATRATPADPWGDAVPVAELNTGDDDNTPSLSFDGLTMYLSSDRPGGLGGVDIWVSTRSSRSAPWSAPVDVRELSSVYDDAGAAPDAAGLLVVFDRHVSGDDRDLWHATRATATSTWGPATRLKTLNTTSQDADPFVSADGLHLLFDSDRNSHSYRELFLASRMPDGEFGDATPAPLVELDSDRADADPWLSPDNMYMVFLSSRTGDDELYDVYFEPPGL